MAAEARQELAATSGSPETGRVGAAYGAAASDASGGRQVDVWA